jgi:probable rRNA maturation factor
MAKLSLSVQYQIDKTELPTRHDFRRWVKAALQDNAGLVELTIRLVDEAEGRELNHSYRHKDYPTNVLTFNYNEDLPDIAGLPLLGDVVLCLPVIRREAAEQGKTLEAHLAHLTVHGVLHMQGFDHETDAEAQTMETLESAIVTALGFDDPYLSQIIH